MAAFAIRRPQTARDASRVFPRPRFLALSASPLSPLPSNVQTFKPTNVFCPIPFLFTLFQTLLHSPKSQVFCFQAIPNSFAKTPGGGGISCPSTRIKMKPQTANSVVQSARCSHRDPKGRQCRTLALDARSGLCPRHLAQLQHELAADHFAHLTTRCHFFQTAQGINYSLMNLYQLLAQNRIYPRRAAVLAYISSLLLRTLPAITADNAAGITYPTEPVPIDVLVPDKDLGSDEDPDLDPGSDAETQTKTKMEVHSDSTNAWDPSIPEPDL